MTFWLLKTEPGEFSFDDLVQRGVEPWDGVSNPMALRNLRAAHKGETCVIYHTGDEKSAVGTATVQSVDNADPKNPRVTIKSGKPIANPHSLAEIKADKLFSDSPLVRQGRLSVVPLRDAQFRFLVGG